MMRKRANKRYDKKVFAKTASRTHYKNLRPAVMRGGERL